MWRNVIIGRFVRWCTVGVAVLQWLGYYGPAHAVSWESAIDLAVSSETSRAPAVAGDRSGTVVVVWQSEDTLSGTIGSDTDILFSRSTDSGLTWSEPQPLNATAAVDPETEAAGRDAIPRIATDGDGFFIVTWISRYDVTGDVGNDLDILASVSTDDGETWSYPTVVNGNASADTADDGVLSGASVATGMNGVIVVVWETDSVLGGIGTDTDIVSARSIDGGASWQSIKVVNHFASADSALDHSPTVIHNTGAEWFVVWVSPHDLAGSGADNDLLIARTTNNGWTWDNAALFTSDAAADGSLSDAGVTIGRDEDSFVALWTRIDSGSSGDVYISQSNDGGSVWSAPQVLADERDNWSPTPAFDSAGTWYVLWRHVEPSFTQRVYVMSSSDQGTTWSLPQPVDDATTITGSSAPATIPHVAGLPLVVYSQSVVRLSSNVNLADSPPVITKHPESKTIDLGEPASFAVDAMGASPLSYKWMKNGVEMPGETSETLAISSVETGDLGDYVCIVENANGSTTSNSAQLALAGGAMPVETTRTRMLLAVSFILASCLILRFRLKT